MTRDPHQYTNLAGDPAHAELLEQARARYRQRLKEAGISLSGKAKKK
nr:hypothetical protein [Akkermansiaceae bacterium]